MSTRNKFRLHQVALPDSNSGCDPFDAMHGSAVELGDIIGPSWDDGPWDAELGAYNRENGPVYYTGNGTETTDDL